MGNTGSRSFEEEWERTLGSTDSQQPDDVPERPSRNCAEHCIGINATVDKVWQLVGDFAGWERWNPLYVQTSGTAQVGETVHFTVSLEGMKPQKGSATVTAVKPPSLLEYQTRAFGGLVKASRYIEIRPLGADRCTVLNGEHMGGLLGWLVYLAAGEKVRLGMKGMNEALKALAENKS